jgi:hypothetical protein
MILWTSKYLCLSRAKAPGHHYYERVCGNFVPLRREFKVKLATAQGIAFFPTPREETLRR